MGDIGDMGDLWEQVPEGCDCCGHDAEDCGMFEAGWVSDVELIPSGAAFCHECAHLLRIERHAEFCAWCERVMVEEKRAEKLGWSYFVDEYGDLHPCCPGCLADRFGIPGRVALRRTQ